MGFIALIAMVIYAFAAGWIHTARTRRESFKEWQRLNGGVVRMMCLLIVVVCIIVSIYKYADVQAVVDAPPSLMTE